MIVFLLYSFVLSSLAFGFYVILKKYLSEKGSRGDDYYFLVAIAAMFISYTLKLLIGIGVPSLYDFSMAAHMAEMLSFWGLLMYFLNQIYFKKISYYRLHKLMITLMFFLAMLVLSIFSFPIVSTSIKEVPKIELFSFYPAVGKWSYLIADLACLFSSVIMFITSPKIRVSKRNLLAVGMLFSSITYLISSINIIFFSGINIIIYFLIKGLGAVAVIFILMAVIEYYYRTKK